MPWTELPCTHPQQPSEKPSPHPWAHAGQGEADTFSGRSLSTPASESSRRAKLRKHGAAEVGRGQRRHSRSRGARANPARSGAWALRASEGTLSPVWATWHDFLGPLTNRTLFMSQCIFFLEDCHMCLLIRWPELVLGAAVLSRCQDLPSQCPQH